jgi:glutathione S-transferase
VLAKSKWLVGSRFTMADVAMAPYVNRLAALAMAPLWQNGRLPNVERWFETIRKRPTFEPAFTKWLPDGLRYEMFANGQKSWPDIQKLIS